MGKIYTWPSLLSPVWVSCEDLLSQPVKKRFSGTIHLIWNSELQRDLWQTPLLFSFTPGVSKNPCLWLPTFRALLFAVCPDVPAAAPLSCANQEHSVNRDVQPAHGTAPGHLWASTRNTEIRSAPVWFASRAGPRPAADRKASQDIKCSCLSILNHCCIGCLPRVLKEGCSQESRSQDLFKMHETKVAHDNLREQFIHMSKWQKPDTLQLYNSANTGKQDH